MSEPEHKRIRREKAERSEREACRKDDEAAKQTYVKQIVDAIKGVIQSLERHDNERNPDKKWDRKWRRYEVRGLWAAAIIGLLAIIVSSVEAYHQRSVLHGLQSAAQQQLDEMEAEQRPWVRVSISHPILVFVEWHHQQFMALHYNADLKDFGHLPARNINIAGVLAAHRNNARETELDLTQRQMCDQAEHSARHDPIGGITIYPEEPDSASSATNSEWEPTYFYLVGCIDFTYGVQSHGKTAFRYIIGTTPNNQFSQIPFPKTGGNRHPEDAELFDWVIPNTGFTFQRDDIGNYPK